jgi:hypothetical protein
MTKSSIFSRGRAEIHIQRLDFTIKIAYEKFMDRKCKLFKHILYLTPKGHIDLNQVDTIF